MKKLMNILMLSCQKASEFIEKKSIFGLNRGERIQLFLHTSMCDACKSYEKQSLQLDSLMEEHLNSELNEKSSMKEGLSPDRKEQIIKDLKEK